MWGIGLWCEVGVFWQWFCKAGSAGLKLYLQDFSSGIVRLRAPD